MNKSNTYMPVLQSIQRLIRPIALTITFLATLLLASCEFWQQPVREYFKEWTEECSIAKYELVGTESYTDKDGNLCIASDQDVPVKLYLINPYHYYIPSNKIERPSGGIIPEINQDPEDTTVLHFTYSATDLLTRDGGGEIGGKLILTHPKNGTPKEFTFNLKCNSKPPAVMGQEVLVYSSNSKYIIFFYLPTGELSTTHINDTHTIYINDTAIATGTAGQLQNASVTPSNPIKLDGHTFHPETLSGYSPFYYMTDLTMHEGDNLSWNIRIEDDNGLSSRTIKASTIVPESHMTLSGDDEIVLTTEDGSNIQTITAYIDEGIVETWTWTCNDTDIVNLSGDGNTRTVEANNGGTTTLNITAKLTDGRVVHATKSIRVISIGLLNTTEETMIVNGDNGDLALTPSSMGFPSNTTYTWHSSNSSVATVDSTGTVTAVAYGTANITVSAQYGGKTVTSSAKTINVYEVSEIQGDNIGFVGTENSFNVEVTATGPNGQGPSSWSQNWSSTNTTVAPTPATTNTNARKITPAKGGSTTIKVEVTINGKKATRQKTLTIYDLVVSGKTLLSQTGTNSSLTLTPSLKSGNTTYSGDVTYTYNSGTTSNATVGTTGTVTAKSTGDGSSTITVTANVNGKTLTKTHTVYVIGVSGSTNFIAGETARAFTTTAKPTGYTYTWSTGNLSVASVDSSSGAITANASGSTNITLKVSKGSEILQIQKAITVSTLTMTAPSPVISGNTVTIAKGEEFTVTTTLSPSFTYSSMTCTSSNSSNASVDNNFKITGKQFGTSNISITLTMSDGTTIVKENVFTVNIVQAHTFDSLSAFSSFLSGMPTNSTGKPYKINITNLTANDVKQADGDTSLDGTEGTLRRILCNNTSKYVDLSDTTLPVTSLKKAFRYCSNLVKPPVIPNGVTDMSDAFANCSSLIKAPNIPNGVTSLNCTFENCTELATGVQTIPSSVKDMGRTFCNCEKMPSVPNIPEGVDSMNWCFAGCKMLDQHIVIPSTVPELVSTFENSGINGKTITVKADLTTPNNWKNTFNGVARVFVEVASQEAGMACEADNSWDNEKMVISGIIGYTGP